MSQTPEHILEQLRALLANAYVPYSHYPVAAVIRSGSGQLYSGVNVENAAYPMTRCAEQSAVQGMVTAGEQRIDEVWIMTRGKRAGTPCGGCRQVLSEFGEPEVKVHCYTEDGLEFHTTIGELLPDAFGPKYL
ncbi:MAG: cytidine deaminase [Meiothermus sp.]|nr:cytidine deaminase [Meiothermus sp.]